MSNESAAAGETKSQSNIRKYIRTHRPKRDLFELREQDLLTAEEHKANFEEMGSEQINGVDSSGKTPLIYLIHKYDNSRIRKRKKGYLNMIKGLLEAGADVNLVTTTQCSLLYPSNPDYHPLMEAYKTTDKKLIRLIKNKGGTIQDDDNHSSRLISLLQNRRRIKNTKSYLKQLQAMLVDKVYDEGAVQFLLTHNFNEGLDTDHNYLEINDEHIKKLTTCVFRYQTKPITLNIQDFRNYRRRINFGFTWWVTLDVHSKDRYNLITLCRIKAVGNVTLIRPNNIKNYYQRKLTVSGNAQKDPIAFGIMTEDGRNYLFCYTQEAKKQIRRDNQIPCAEQANSAKRRHKGGSNGNSKRPRDRLHVQIQSLRF